MSRNKIHILEDEPQLIREAREAALASQRYVVLILEPPQALNRTYWMQLGISEHDIVVLDLNLNLSGVQHTGLQVVRTLESLKQQQRNFCLEKLLIATSMAKYIDPATTSPIIGACQGFDIFGFEKYTHYGHKLLEKVDDIYAGKVQAINAGWR